MSIALVVFEVVPREGTCIPLTPIEAWDIFPTVRTLLHVLHGDAADQRCDSRKVLFNSSQTEDKDSVHYVRRQIDKT